MVTSVNWRSNENVMQTWHDTIDSLTNRIADAMDVVLEVQKRAINQNKKHALWTIPVGLLVGAVASFLHGMVTLVKLVVMPFFCMAVASDVRDVRTIVKDTGRSILTTLIMPFSGPYHAMRSLSR